MNYVVLFREYNITIKFDDSVYIRSLAMARVWFYEAWWPWPMTFRP